MQMLPLQPKADHPPSQIPSGSKESEGLVDKVVSLVSLFVGGKGEGQEDRRARVLQYIVRILSSRLSPAVVDDEFHVAQSIQNHLAHDGRDGPKKAQRFLQLHQRLQASKTPKNRWAVLYMLQSIAEANRLEKQQTAVQYSLSKVGLESFAEAAQPYKQKQILTNGAPQNVPKTFESAPEPVLPNPDETFGLPLKQKLRKEQAQRAKDNLSFEVAPEVLLRDIVYVLQGIEGKYIKLSKVEDTFAISPEIGASRSIRDLVGRLCEAGWLYRRISSFLEICFNQEKQDTKMLGKDQKKSKLPPVSGVQGLVGQSFCYAVQQEINDYYRLIAILEGQINAPGASNLTLRRLLVWIQDPTEKLKVLAWLIDSVTAKKGGALASVVRSFATHGDPFVSDFVHHLMGKICKPLFHMIRLWITEGDLSDPHNEFFVAVNPSVPPERLWYDKYSLRTELIPSFISNDLAKKILLIGKSINFMRLCCKEVNMSVSSTVFASAEFEYTDDESASLSAVVSKVAAGVNKNLMEILFNKYKMFEHFQAIKRYLLLGQGDFIQYLMDLLGADLAKPANALFRHNLVGILESAIRASNAQYDDVELLNRLDIRLLEPNDPSKATCYGWDVFSLDYQVDAPINTVFIPTVMSTYLRIFNFLWRIKRVEYSLSATWRTQMNSAHSIQSVREVAGQLHQFYIQRNEMIHFIHNLQHYIMFEVLEYSWEELVMDMKKAEDLDELIEAHSTYLNNIMVKSLLSSPSLLKDLSNVLEITIRFCRAQEMVYSSALEESVRKSNRMQQLRELELQGKWGIEAEEEDEGLDVAYKVPVELQKQLDSISKEYHVAVKIFRDALAKQPDENLRFLTFRTDFNEYYENKERKSLPKVVDTFMPGEDFKS